MKHFTQFSTFYCGKLWCTFTSMMSSRWYAFGFRCLHKLTFTRNRLKLDVWNGIVEGIMWEFISENSNIVDESWINSHGSPRIFVERLHIKVSIWINEIRNRVWKADPKGVIHKLCYIQGESIKTWQYSYLNKYRILKLKW